MDAYIKLFLPGNSYRLVRYLVPSYGSTFVKDKKYSRILRVDVQKDPVPGLASLTADTRRRIFGVAYVNYSILEVISVIIPSFLCLDR